MELEVERTGVLAMAVIGLRTSEYEGAVLQGTVELNVQG